eukprot:TRINITY_DN7991_c0_g1_i1.p1 TRINITY_DN7991_c0_g1~~TRINITY_DN7991_c0_g1_i1.p1  ORF type:complete len:345 (-),score=143.29 TRINITY_DN7991_c0_g1_i1:347-1381(-)
MSPPHPTSLRLLSALFYGLVSLAIMLVNKQVLTLQKFPSPLFLGLGQMLATLLILRTLSLAGFLSLPPLNLSTISQLLPLPLFYLSNMLFGLLVTQELSLPMITVLRRFSILFTLLLQISFLKIIPSKPISASVALMILGALLAASNDLSFSIPGYAFITLNNLSTALCGIYSKLKMNSKQAAFGPYGLAYLNSAIMIGPLGILVLLHEDLEALRAFGGWGESGFLLGFLSSCALGCLLIYSSNLCTHINSPLDTNIIGCLKNVVVTYVGMVFGGDYIFSPMNFLGINVSIIGSLVYTYISFFHRKGPHKSTPRESESREALLDPSGEENSSLDSTNIKSSSKK